MNENERIETTVSEYKNLVETAGMKADDNVDYDRLALALSKDHDWTHQGALAIVGLANDYGAFMLKNALALAMALEKEDGNMGF